jgi:uncharacterized protein
MDDGRGLDTDGAIAREGSLARVGPAFAPVVEAARARIAGLFGDALHSAYLYGSVPRGTAVPGTSDLDLQLVFRDAVTGAQREAAGEMEADLDAAFGEVDGVGVLLGSVRDALSELERHDFGFFVACLCTPLLGEDLAVRLPRYRPTSLLARETNGDLHLVLPRWRERAGRAETAAERAGLGRGVGRRLVRTGFTLVMPLWGGWTSDLGESAEIFGRYHPERLAPMRVAAAEGRAPSGDPGTLSVLIDGLGPWLAAEYRAVHGEKAPRP